MTTNDLVERYVHEVGRYLPQKERRDIQAELRSLIQDQLDDRYPGSPSQAEVAAVLAELGDPRRMAVSYSGQQYLVGPALYPFMMMVLRYGWLIIPSVVVFVNVFGALISPQPRLLLAVLLETIIGTGQMILIFSAVVVLFFAIMQHSGVEPDTKEKTREGFNPLELPPVDDPSRIDRFETAFGIAFGIFSLLVMLYFLHAGGLTLRFNLNDPGEVIPVSATWMILFIAATFAMIALHILVLRLSSWNVALWLVETVLEVFGTICLYFVLFRPFFDHLMTLVPALSSIPLLDRSPEITAIIAATITLASRGVTLVRLWHYRSSDPAPVAVQTTKAK